MTLLTLIFVYLSNAHAAPEPFYYCPLSEDQKISYKEKFNQSLSFTAKCPMSVATMCSKAKDQCKEKTGNSSCFFGLEVEPSCTGYGVVTEEQLVELRSNNYTYVEARFAEITRSRDFQEKCCGANQACKTGFAATELWFLEGFGSGELIGRTSTRTVDLELSIAEIGNCQNAECLEGLLLHELGHVCHIWQAKTSTSKGDPEYQGVGIPSLEKTKADLKKLLGDKGADCVLKGLQARLKVADPANASPGTLTSWLEEAYADAMFIGSWPAARIAYNCNAIEDKEHALPTSYMSCFNEVESFKNKYCEKVVSTPKVEKESTSSRQRERRHRWHRGNRGRR